MASPAYNSCGVAGPLFPAPFLKIVSSSSRFWTSPGMDVIDPSLRYTPPTFRYAGVPEGPDYEAWREEFCRRFRLLDADTATAERIECTVEISQIGPLSLGTAYGSSGSFLRTRSLLSDGHDDLVLLTAIKGA